MVGISQRKKWPVEPLARALDRVIVEERATGLGGLAQRRAGYNKREAEKLAQMFNHGLHEGFITLRLMDTICIDILGLHPMQVYNDYFDPVYDAIHVGKPCKTCGGPKEVGRLHDCMACHTKKTTCACGCGGRTDAKRRNKYLPGHNTTGRTAAA